MTVALDPRDIGVIVNDQTRTPDDATSLASLAVTERGDDAVVPAGEIWFIASIECINTHTTVAQNAFVWLVPHDELVTPTTTKWLKIPGIEIAAKSVLERNPPVGFEVIHILHAGDSIRIMGGLDNINVVILGWRVRGAV